MNYTTNYHLPQWVETDRIQMEHFNQAMADIDEGIAEERSARQEAINDLSQSAAQSQAAAKTELFNNLRQSGYDLYQMAGRAACKNLFSFAAKSMVINTLHTAEELARAEICLHLTGGGIQIGPAHRADLGENQRRHLRVDKRRGGEHLGFRYGGGQIPIHIPGDHHQAECLVPSDQCQQYRLAAAVCPAL